MLPEHLSHLYGVVWHLNRAYFPQPHTVKTTTPQLRNPATLEKYVAGGLKYIRRLDYNYHHIMREPTDGCTVELTKEPEIGSIPIDSAKARKLIQRRSYF
jgi:hypothetical protein